MPLHPGEKRSTRNGSGPPEDGPRGAVAEEPDRRDLPPRLHRTGLTERAAAERLERDGPNSIPSLRERPAWLALLAQMTHFFALLLWMAAALALVARLVPLSVAIVVVVLLNGVFAFAQEHRDRLGVRRLAGAGATPLERVLYVSKHVRRPVVRERRVPQLLAAPPY